MDLATSLKNIKTMTSFRKEKLNIRQLLLLLFGSISISLSAQNNIHPWYELNPEFNQVNLCLEEGKSDEANNLLKIIEQKQSQNLSDTTLFLYNVCKARYFFQKENYEQAINFLLIAKTLWENKFDILAPGYLELIFLLSNYEKENGNIDAAISYLQEVVVTGSTIFEEFEIYGRALGELAKLYIDKKQFSNVEELLTKADVIMNKFHEKGSYESYQYKVDLYVLLMNMGKYEKSIQIIDEIIPIIALIDDELNKRCYSNALYAKATNYYLLEQYDKAEHYYNDGIKFSIEKIGKYDIMLKNEYKTLFQTLCRTNKEKEIDTLIPIMQDYYKQTQNDSTYFEAILAGADNLMAVENYNKAIELYELLLSIAEKNSGKNSGIYYNICNKLSVVNIQSGNLADADNYLNIQLSIINQVNGKNTPVFATYLHNRGKLLLDQKKYKEAVETLTEALELQQKLDISSPRTSQYLEEAKKHLE